MCGIFGYVGSSNATELVFDGLKQLEYRGYDSWGIVSAINGSLHSEKHVGKIGSSSLTLGKASVALGHTRWATHGGVTKLNSHPHFDCHNQIAVVHNGIIENYDVLKKALISKKHVFISDTDTEVFAHLVEEEMKSLSFLQAVKKSFKKIKGLNTIVVMNTDGDLVACKNGSPLLIGITKSKEIFLSSDLPSLLSYTNNVSVIEDGQIIYIQAGILLTKCIFKKYMANIEDHGKGNYPNYTLKEINDHPESLLNIINSSQSSIKFAIQTIAKARLIYAVGCGTAFHSLLVGTYLFAQYSIKQVVAISASEFTIFASLLSHKDVIICSSQSGETIDTIEAVRLAKSHGVKSIALVNVPGSTLAREADVVINLHAGIERSVVSTKAFTNMLAALLMMAGQTESVARISKKIKLMLSGDLEQTIIELASRIAKHQSMFVVGRGINYPIAMESALKLKETSYIHAEGLAGGELKHGTLALIEKGVPCIVLLSNDEEYSSTISGAMELKARGAWVIGVGPIKEQVFDDWIQIPRDKDMSFMLNIIPMQLLGYYVALAKHLDPDMPRNLAKSVTVK